MMWTLSMGDTSNRFSLCVNQSSRKTHRERPYVSRPFWSYERGQLNAIGNSRTHEISPVHCTHQMIQSRCVHIIKAPIFKLIFCFQMSMNVLKTYRDCPFCLKLLFEPVSILCGHTFCFLCLERFLITSDSILNCPICRDDLTYLRSCSNHFKPNTILHNLFREEYQEEYERRRHELEQERKKMIKKRLIIGNTHQVLPYDYHQKQHEWTLFIKFENDDDDDDEDHQLTEIDEYIKQIDIHLHPTFTPSRVVLDKAPFRLTHIGWGVFTIHLAIEFHAKWNKSDLVTNWFLSFANNGSQKRMEIGFEKSTDNMTVN